LTAVARISSLVARGGTVGRASPLAGRCLQRAREGVGFGERADREIASYDATTDYILS